MPSAIFIIQETLVRMFEELHNCGKKEKESKRVELCNGRTDHCVVLEWNVSFQAVAHQLDGIRASHNLTTHTPFIHSTLQCCVCLTSATIYLHKNLH